MTAAWLFANNWYPHSGKKGFTGLGSSDIGEPALYGECKSKQSKFVNAPHLSQGDTKIGNAIVGGRDCVLGDTGRGCRQG